MFIEDKLCEEREIVHNLKAKSHIVLKMKLNIHMNVSVHTPLTATP